MVQKVAVAAKKLEVVRESLNVTLPSKLMFHPMLANVSPTTLNALNEQFTEIKLAPGTTLYRVDEPAHRVFFVVDGTIQTLHHSRAGESFEGDWRRGSHALGMGELFSGQQYYAETAFARAATEVFALPLSLVKELAGRDPALAMNLAKSMAERQHRAWENERSVLETGFVRVADYLIRLVVRDGKEVAPDLYQIKATQEEIAAASGLNPRTVARAMKALQKKGRLYIRRGEYVLRQPLSLTQALMEEEATTNEQN